MWRVEKKLNVKRLALLSLTSKKTRGKGIQREDNRREKVNRDLYIFFFYCMSSFFCSCLIKAIFCLLYFVPPMTTLGYLLLYGGQWECSWR